MPSDTLKLLRSIRLRTRIPASQLNYTDNDTLTLANEVMLGEVVPLIMAEQQEHFVTRADLPITDGEQEYRIPSRAMGAKLRDAVLVNTTGGTYNLVRWGPEETVGWENVSGQPNSFVVEGTRLRLYPIPSGMTNWKLRMTFYARPGALVLPAQAAKVDFVSGNAAFLLPQQTAPDGSITAGDPTAIFGAGGTEPVVDLIRAVPHYETLATEIVGEYDESDRSLVLNPEAVAELQPGDWVCLAGQAPVPQLPEELHALLVAKTAAVQLSSIGDSAGAQEAASIAANMEKRAVALILPRVDGQPIRQVNGFRRWRGPGSNWRG